MPAKRIFTIPTSQDDLERLKRHCQALDLPAPRCWRHTFLHRTLQELIAADAHHPPGDSFAATPRLTGLKDPLVLFCNVAPQEVQQMVRAYKAEGQWPVFAVVTKQSLPMPLGVLLEHLLDDRSSERNLRQRRPSSTQTREGPNA